MKHTQDSDHLSEKSTGIKENITWQDALKLLKDLGEINDKED